MRSVGGNLIKRFTGDSRMILARLCFMHQSSICKLLLFGCPLLIAGAAGGIWGYKKYRQKTNVHIMVLNLVRGVPLTPKEKETMLETVMPPPSERTPFSWLRKVLQR